MKIKFIILILALNLYNIAYSQESESKETPQPLELPRFVIEGVEQLNVQSGIKQYPQPPRKLTGKELDSLNSLEKQSSLFLNPVPFPEKTFDKDYKKGFVRASAGRFLTPELEAGYGINLEGYELYLNAGGEVSDGHIKNADYQRMFFKATSDFIAPTKYFIFGGSRTRTTLDLKTKSYNLYSIDEPLNRDATNLNFNVDVDGNWDGLQFFTGAGINSLQMKTDDSKAIDNSFAGYIKLKNLWRNFLMSGNLELDIRSLRGNNMSFAQANTTMEYFQDQFSISIGGGLQYYRTNTAIDRADFMVYSDLEYRVNKLLTISGGIKSGTRKNSYTEMLILNPYIAHNANIDFPYDKAVVTGSLFFHPQPTLGITIGINYSMTARMPIFRYDNEIADGSFVINYNSTNIMQATFEGFWNPFRDDYLVMNLTASKTTMNGESNEVPYIPQIKTSLDYKRVWFYGFGTKIGLAYIGTRFADIENEVELDAFVNLNAELNYRFNRALSAQIRFDNLTNSNIYYWERYKERAMFMSVGIMWQF